MIQRLWSHRDLLFSLVRRQFRLRYRQSVAGFGWAILPPLVTMGVATIVFHEIAKVDTGEVPYSLFALAALAPWTFFANSLTASVASVVQSSQMITRIGFPRAVLPLSMVGAGLLDLAIAGVVFLVYSYATGSSLPITALWFPLLLLVEITLVVGVVMLTSALNVFVRDVKLAVPLGTSLWLFLTPVMYPLSSVPQELHGWYLLNPMTGLVESFRDVLLPPGRSPDVSVLMPSLIGSTVLLVIGIWYFSAVEHRFADVV